MKNIKIRYILAALVLVGSFVWFFIEERNADYDYGPGAGLAIFAPFIFAFVAYLVGGIIDYLRK